MSAVVVVQGGLDYGPCLVRDRGRGFELGWAGWLKRRDELLAVRLFCPAFCRIRSLILVLWGAGPRGNRR